MNKYLKLFGLLLLILFLVVYAADYIGYYDLIAHKKTVLTEEKMEEFEKDVQDGKEMDAKKYLEDVETNYRNDLSITCSNISIKASNYFKEGVESIFKIIKKLVSD